MSVCVCDRDRGEGGGIHGKKAMHLIYIQAKYSPSSTPEIKLFVFPFARVSMGLLYTL